MGILHCIVTWLPMSAFGKQSVLVCTTGMMMRGTKHQNGAAECCCLTSIFQNRKKVGKLMLCCPSFDLHRGSGGSSATVGDWVMQKWSVFQNSSSEQITGAPLRTALPWLLERLKDDFFLHLTCVFLVMKLSKGAISCRSWRMSQVVESNLTKTEREKEISSVQHFYFSVEQIFRGLLGIQPIFKNVKIWCQEPCVQML